MANYEKFKALVDAWTASQTSVLKLEKVVENENLKETARYTRSLQDLVFLEAIAKLFGEDYEDAEFRKLLLSDGWFWAEWDNSRECYRYVQGKIDGWKL